jgi:hypothetical protein
MRCSGHAGGALVQLAPETRGMTGLMKRLVLIVISATVLSASASAAGIDSRTVTCPSLQGLIAARGFIFISQPVLGDFVVSGAYYCGGGEMLQLRSVPTMDNPQCLVNYCIGREKFD